MSIWIDAQLSPSLAKWITDNFGVSAQAVRDLGLREAKDFPIFQAAREANATVLTKDADFPHLLAQHGPSSKGPVAHLWEHVEPERTSHSVRDAYRRSGASRLRRIHRRDHGANKHIDRYKSTARTWLISETKQRLDTTTLYRCDVLRNGGVE